MKLAVNNPNFSVIMPTSCNAKCNFCYWKPDVGLTENRFREVINSIPDIFTQCSITGGEPTKHPTLLNYLNIARDRFAKVVLNTNGYYLNKDQAQKVDFVNISRHHYDDEENRKIFNTDSVPNRSRLSYLCSYQNTTLNCFLPNDFDNLEFIEKYIEFAKWMDAKVAFRKYYSDLNILDKVDKEDTLIDFHSCGACLHRHHKINEVDVTFKYSVNETTDAMNGDIYELVLQANGNLTVDWAGKKILKYKKEI